MENIANPDIFYSNTNFNHTILTLPNMHFFDNLLYSISFFVFGFVFGSLVVSYIALFRKYTTNDDDNVNDDIDDIDDDVVNEVNDDFIIIGLIGKKYAGKDTVADYLVKNHEFVKLAFAGQLKLACETIFGFTNDQLHDPEQKEIIDNYWGHSPREILQKVGTELFRNELPKHCKNISNDIWIKSVERKINNMRDIGFTRFVITDVRFPNEQDFITRFGENGECWKIMRPTLIDESQTTTHESEIFAENAVCDYVVDNSGTLGDLYNMIDRIMQKHES